MYQITKILDEQTVPGGALRDFPKAPTVRAEFTALATTLCNQISDRSSSLSPEQLNGLVVKLAKYAAKKQWNFHALTGELATIADAISKDSVRLLEPELSIKQIIKYHEEQNRRYAVLARQALVANPDADNPPTFVAWSDDKSYKLVECITQRHLQEQTAVLGHCVGGTSLSVYRDKMARGATRIFSLCTAEGVPVVTIDYDTKKKAIIQIEGNPRSITGNEIFFPALCQCIHTLTTELPVTKIFGLPQSKGQVLIRNGTYVPVSKAKISDVLSGTAIVDDTMDKKDIHLLAASHRLTLDVTALDISLLPLQLKCNIASGAVTFDASQIESAEDIYLPNATDFVAKYLRSAGALKLPSAEKITMPLLAAADRIQADKVSSLDLPELNIMMGSITLKAALNFSIPKLRSANMINVPNAEVFEAPELETVGYLITIAQKKFAIPKLRTADNIMTSNKKLIAPKLEKVGKIDCWKPLILDAPELVSADAIRLIDAETINIPKLRRAGEIQARNVKDFKALRLEVVDKDLDLKDAVTLTIPLLRSVGFMTVGDVEHFYAPALETARAIFAHDAKTFRAPLLRSAYSVTAPSVRLFAAPLLQTEKPLEILCKRSASAEIFDTPQLQREKSHKIPIEKGFGARICRMRRSIMATIGFAQL